MTYEINFNISYSLLSVFKTSPLQFYFQYIDELPYDTKVVSCYGDGGTAVHTVAEEYINNKTLPTETLVKEWTKHKIASKKGFNGQPLNMHKYDKMGFQAKVIIDKYKKDGYALQTEMLIEHEFEGTGIKVKGYIDCVATKGDRVVLIDWKTNSEVKNEHKDQQLFYAFLYNLKFGKIPDEFVWHYLKLNKTLQQRFITPREIDEQRTAIREFISNIKLWGKDIKHYDAGDYKQPFNQFLQVCETVVLERMNRNQQNFVITITGNYCKLSGDVNDLIHKGLVRELTYLEKNRFYVIKNLRPRFITQYINKNGYDMAKANEYAERRCYDIGRHTLYNKSLGLFPIGMIPRVKKILQDYCDYKDASLNIEIIDKRDKDIMNKTLPIPDIQTDKILRPYQEDAIKTFTENPVCVLQLPTSSGKTFIASHIISQMKKQTLVLIDRIELLDQLHTVLSENLNCKIGKIGDSECDIQNITVATVQTLSRNDIKDDVKDWLNNVSFVVVDEFHKAASESFYKVFNKIPNAKYRLGLTGTAKRTDGKELALFGLIGDIEVSVTINDLIRQGYVMKPDITFFRVPKTEEDGEDYMKDYTNSIINSDWRNSKICDLVRNNKDKKILILTKFVQKHGKVLSKSIPQAMHINSGTPRKKRKEMMKIFRSQQGVVLITTTQIAGTGLDIEDLDIIINASGNDSEITSVQMLGRVLRTSKGKLTAYYYDFLDSGRYTKNNSRNRMNQFRNEGHVVKNA